MMQVESSGNHLSFCFRILSILLFNPTTVWTASVTSRNNDHFKQVELLMPDVKPTVADSYLCHSMKVDATFYITGFQPKANMNTAHHILIFGCEEPGLDHGVWNCGEMQADTNDYKYMPVCRSASNIIYAWAMDAPELRLPEGVAFKVGGDTGIKSIVLQVHYKDVTPFIPPNNGEDHSGVNLVTTDISQPKRAGVYLLGTAGEIAPHSTTYMETACSYNEPIELHPFAFRTHAHKHGQVVSGYRVRTGVWTEIGRKSPQLPQMFYNVTYPGMSVKQGDLLAARCTMVNNDSILVSIGSTAKDEMCNFYMMYYVDDDRLPEESTCFSPGPPKWDWYKLQELHPENAPRSASIIPGTTEIIEATRKYIHKMEKAMQRERQQYENNINQMLDAFGEYNYGKRYMYDLQKKSNIIDKTFKWDRSIDEAPKQFRQQIDDSTWLDENQL